MCDPIWRLCGVSKDLSCDPHLFCYFNNKEYLHAIGMQRLLWKFQESINHPFLTIPREIFPNLVAEDIAHAVRSKRGQGDFAHLDTAYRWLGSMLRHKETQRLNILQSRSLKGWETKKRLTYRLLWFHISKFVILFRYGEPCIQRSSDWVDSVITSFENGSFEHYRLPTKETKRGVTFVAQETATKDTEESKKALTPVKYILTRNWENTLRTSMEKVISKQWTFGNGIAAEDLRSYNLFQNTVVQQ